MIYEVTLNNKKYVVEVEKGNAAIVDVKKAEAALGQDTAALTPKAPQQVPPAAVPAQVSPSQMPSLVKAADGEAIKAPMPGIILDIKVAAASKVKKGDVIFILEAMKMENEITAPSDGNIIQILTAKGSTVNTGDILAVIQ